jgi:hypothetical protein
MNTLPAFLPYNSTQVMTQISQFELNRIRDCENAWYACYEALMTIDQNAMLRPGLTGKEAAVAFIQELGKRPKV